MLKLGCLLLGLWSVLNLAPSSWILFAVLARGENVPGLTAALTESQIRGIEAEALAAANSIGVYANGLNVAFSMLFAALIWKALLRRKKWAFWAMAASSLVAVLGGVGADHVVGTRNPEINFVSAMLLGVGFACCASVIFRTAANQPRD